MPGSRRGRCVVAGLACRARPRHRALRPFLAGPRLFQPHSPAPMTCSPAEMTRKPRTITQSCSALPPVHYFQLRTLARARAKNRSFKLNVWLRRCGASDPAECGGLGQAIAVKGSVPLLAQLTNIGGSLVRSTAAAARAPHSRSPCPTGRHRALLSSPPARREHLPFASCARSAPEIRRRCDH